jgi:hypothetical protein
MAVPTAASSPTMLRGMSHRFQVHADLVEATATGTPEGRH